jgi:uncharacterized protein (TIGR02453 family)
METFRFLKDLKKNNNKDWFDTNRGRYEAAKEEFLQLTTDVIQGIGAFDPGVQAAGLDAKKCISRINRDIRFAKDKTPYKTNFFSIINQGGKKSNLAGYFLQVQPGDSFIGGGVYMPMPPDLLDIRKEIQYNFDAWKKIAESKSLLKIYPDGVQAPDVLTRVPKGFDESDPAAEYVKMKGFFTYINISDDEVYTKAGLKKMLKAYETALPLVNFINGALS